MPFALLIQIVPIVVLLVLGFTVGTLVERAHFKRLDLREAAVRDIFMTNLRKLPTRDVVRAYGLVTGEVVIASDYFKTFVTALRKLVGGELYAFESLMVRARREALLRMVESAKSMGADAVMNVRFATSNIGGVRRQKAAAMVEMYAYGTAVRLKNSADADQR